MASVQATASKPHAKSIPISTTVYQEAYEQQQLRLQQQQQSKRASTRLSTYSITPTLTPSIAPSHLSHDSNGSMTNEKSSNPLAHDVSTVQATLSRLDEPRLTNQRYIVSDAKKEEISKLALGAKLERALGRRMSKQDATFTDKGKAKAMAPRTIVMPGPARSHVSASSSASSLPLNATAAA